MTLRMRLTLVAAAAVAVSIALVALLVISAEHRQLRVLVDADLRTQAAAIADSLLETGEVGEDLLGENAAFSTSVVQVVDAEANVVALAAGQVRLPVDDRVLGVAAGEHDRFYWDVDIDGENGRMLTVPLRSGALQVARPVTDVDEHLFSIAGMLALITLAGVSLAVVLGGLVARTALRPLTRLTASAEHVAVTRDLGGRLDVRGHDELGRLASSLNTMLEALDRSQRSQQQLVADASHELRTPLASLLTNVQVLERADGLPDGDRARLVTDLRAEIEGLTRTVDDLLDLADEAPREEPEDLALDRLVHRSAEWVRHRHPGVVIETDLAPTIVRGGRRQIERAVGNLLDNAVKYNAPGGQIQVRLDERELVVRDHGPGMQVEDLDQVFERFYRARGARSRPGAGLGLAIVRQVVDAHRWQVSAENAPDGGAVFRIRFRPGSSSTLSATSGTSQVRPPWSREAAAGRRGGRAPRVPRFLGVPQTWLVALTAAPLLVVVGVAAFSRENGPPPLVTVSGTLNHCGDRFCVDETVVDFGPDWYLGEAWARHDFDGDGVLDQLGQELSGLLGQDVTLETDRGDLDADVYTIDGMPFRAADGELPSPARDEGVGATTAVDPTTPEPTGDGELTGALKRCGERLCVDSIELDVGPYWYQQQTVAPADLDGDGQRSTITEELTGLLGATVHLDVTVDGDEADVLAIDGNVYRDSRSPPPWVGGPLPRERPSGRPKS